MKSIITVILLLILLTFVFTFPLALRLNSYIPGFSSTDEPYGALWHFWWMKYALVNHLNSANTEIIAAPFGQIIHSAYVYWHSINKLSTLITNQIFTYNIQVLASFVLTGIITYALSLYIFKSNFAALFSAIIFAFCPYHSVRSWQHLGLSFIQWMPLYILSLLLLKKDKIMRNILFAALSFSLVMGFDLYYAYFMFIATILFIIFYYFYYRNLKETFILIKSILIAGIVVLAIESFDLYQVIKFMFGAQKSNIAHGVYGYVRPFEDLFAQSARPLSYLLPASVHPVFGKFTENFIGTALYGGSFTEHTLYLGWIPLLLAFLAVKKLLSRANLSHANASDSKTGNFYLSFFIFLVIAAWLFSQPPWWSIFGLKLYMPSFFMYRLAPMFRAYCRFGVVVMLAVAVLAGAGLEFILGRFKTQKAKFAITAFFCSLVLFEFWNYPPYKVIDVSGVPGVYYWLKGQPGDFTIAEYPLDINGANEMYKFYQTAHEKKIINGTTPGTYANKVAQAIIKLSAPKTTGILKWMGARYILVHKQDYLNTELIEDRNELDKIPKNPDLKLIKTFPAQECTQKGIVCIQKTGPIDVYEVITQPIRPELEEK